MKSRIEKPPYEIPTMKQIEALPWNGFNVVSTFSGGGGSCLGYRMAGYKVLWANEFVESARETYKLNHPNSILNPNDIRSITGQEIIDAIGGQEIDIFDGSPPCASFSSSGVGHKKWGKKKQYSDTAQVTDDLFFEYTRLIKETQPKVFIAENVSGLVRGKAKGYFKIILRALKDAGYNVKAKLLNAEWLGVPQSRRRLIFIGVRNDLKLDPVFPSPLPYNYSVREAIPDILDDENDQITPENDIRDYALYKHWLKIGIGKSHHKRFDLKKLPIDKPSFTILACAGHQTMASTTHPIHPRKLTVHEVKRLQSFPEDYKLSGTYAQQVERVGRSVPPIMMYHISRVVYKEILCKIK